MWIQHSDSVSKGFAFRTKFINDTFQQRSKVRVLVPEEYETMYVVFTINKAGFIYVVLRIYPYQERGKQESGKIRLGKMQN